MLDLVVYEGADYHSRLFTRLHVHRLFVLRLTCGDQLHVLIVGAQDMLRPIFVRTASQTHALQIHAATDMQTLKAQIASTTGDNT